MNFITFTPESFTRFKTLYQECEPKGTFLFEGHEVLKGYAKYMIEFIEGEIRASRLN